jgi:hypothetical protein
MHRRAKERACDARVISDGLEVLLLAQSGGRRLPPPALSLSACPRAHRVQRSAVVEQRFDVGSGLLCVARLVQVARVFVVDQRGDTTTVAADDWHTLRRWRRATHMHVL